MIMHTYLIIETIWLHDIIIDDFDLQAAFGWSRKVLDELGQLWTTNTVSTVNCDPAIEFFASHGLFECGGHLFVIALFSRFAISVSCANCIDTASNVVELGSGKKLVVGIFGVSSF